MEDRLHQTVGPVVVMGVSGSGKSLIGSMLAEALGLPFIEGDRLHPQANVTKMSAGIPLSDEDRWPWLDRVGEELTAAVRERGGAVAACSALRQSYRDRLRAVAGRGLRFVFLSGSRELLLGRMSARRHHFMPVSLLDSQLATLEPPLGEAGVLTIDVAPSAQSIVDAARSWLTAQR